MSIVDSIIQRKAGQPSVYSEQAQAEGSTIGHSQADGGLRGHSLGDTWPYRVVIWGDGRASIERNGSEGTGPVFSRHGAHQIAGLCRKLLDSGDIKRPIGLV